MKNLRKGERINDTGDDECGDTTKSKYIYSNFDKLPSRTARSLPVHKKWHTTHGTFRHRSKLLTIYIRNLPEDTKASGCSPNITTASGDKLGILGKIERLICKI